jgi:Na+-transporting NADH:ubiquinone oxidoreductase subunit F
MPDQDGTARIVVNDGERIIPARPERPLLFSLMAERIFIPSACGGRASCGQCRVRITSGARDHVVEERALLSAEEMSRGVHLACQTRGFKELHVRLPHGYLQARQFACRVSAIRDPAPGMREVDLDLVEPARMTFVAGQYVQFVLPGTEGDEQPVYRAYSVASPPSRFQRLTLLMAFVQGGACTPYVFQRLRVGDDVHVNGPFGAFSVRESGRELLFIAGGSGIAPVRAMLLDLAERGVDRRATFFYSTRTAADLIYRSEIANLGRALMGFRFIPVLSHPKPGDAWTGEIGGLPAVLARLLPRLDHHEAYLCGGPGLIDASIGALKSRGLADELIFFDKFS